MHLLWGPKQSAIGKLWQIPSAADISKLCHQHYFSLSGLLIPSLCVSSYFPIFPKDCFLLIIRIIICYSPMTCAAIYNIYNLWTETYPKIEMDPGHNPGLTSVQWVRKSHPLLFLLLVHVAASPATLPRHRLCWTSDNLLPRQENPVKLSECLSVHVGFWRRKVICYTTSPVLIDSPENWVVSPHTDS